jgi:Flp pilus assembly protein TadD
VWSVSMGLFSAESSLEGSQRRVTLRGQVVSESAYPIDHPIPVRLESRVSHATTYTDGAGNFIFEEVAVGSSSYFSVNVDGFRPVRQRVESNPRFRGLLATIVLEPLKEPSDSGESPGPGDRNLVDLSQLLAVIPEEAREKLAMAGNDARDGDYQAAAKHLEEAIGLAPMFYEAQNALGVMYSQLGRDRDAERHFEIATELNPNTAEPLINLGILYLREVEAQPQTASSAEARQSVLEKAIDALERAVERDSLSATAEMYLGSALYMTGANDRAASALNRALFLDEELDDARFTLADVYVRLLDFEAALTQLTTYLAINPDSPRREEVENMRAELERLLRP